MQKKKEHPSEELYGELGRLFNFTRGDLEANRAGFASFRQKNLYRKEHPSVLLMGVLLIIFWVIVTPCLLLLQLQNAQTSWGIYGTIGILTVIVFGMIGLLIYNLPKQSWLEGRLDSIDVEPARMSDTTYVLQGDSVFLPISQHQYQVLDELTLYRVYGLKSSGLILSIERNLDGRII